MSSICNITENISNESGGLRTVIINLYSFLKENYELDIICNKKEDNDPFLSFPSEKIKPWGYSNALSLYLKENVINYDLFHLHGVFMHSQFISSTLALKNDIPYLVSPHGMLEPWLLNDKKIKKRLYFEMILKNLLKSSNAIHAITPSEKDNLFKLTKHKNIVEIPNFIFQSKIPKEIKYEPKEEYILFLGRLHPVKGLDILIEAFSQIQNKKIKLKIIGGENNYSKLLKKKIDLLNLNNRIQFLGSVYGNEKYDLFSNAKVFVSPSHTEAIGMVNLEAAACKTPVITTLNTGIKTEWNENGGVLINLSVTNLRKSLDEACDWSEEERKERGQKLSEFVQKNYSWEEKGYLWTELYDYLITDTR